jgi:hypothetical protein
MRHVYLVTKRLKLDWQGFSPDILFVAQGLACSSQDLVVPYRIRLYEFAVHGNKVTNAIYAMSKDAEQAFQRAAYFKTKELLGLAADAPIMSLSPQTAFGILRSDEMMTTLKPENFQCRSGCDMVWHQIDDEKYGASTTGDHCKSRIPETTHLEVSAVLYPDCLIQTDKFFNGDNYVSGEPVYLLRGLPQSPMSEKDALQALSDNMSFEDSVQALFA